MYIIQFTRQDTEDVVFSIVKYENDQDPEVYYTRHNKLSLFTFEEMVKHTKELLSLFQNVNLIIHECTPVRTNEGK